MENKKSLFKKLLKLHAIFGNHWVYLEEPPHFTLPTRLSLGWQARRMSREA